MQLGKELEGKTEKLWEAFIGMSDETRKEIHKEITAAIMNALENRSAKEGDLVPLKNSARLCANWHIFGDESVDEFAKNLIKAVRELDESRGVSKEHKILWIRVLMAALEKPYIREASKDIRLSHLNMFFYHALEAEADEDPNCDLMTWYEEFIDRGMLYKYESRMFNRLAYFWLNAYDSQDHADKAKAYFKAMERRGINFDNPYNGFYGRNDHEELVGYLLKDEYSRKRSLYLTKYVADLADAITNGNAEKANLIDLRKTVNALHCDIHYGKSDQTMEVWDDAVIAMCRALEECCDRPESEESAGVFAECLSEWDNWLLRYIEIENKEGTEEAYYSLIEEWEQRISRIQNDRAWVMLSSLREILINRYNEARENEKLIKMLEKHTGDADAATHLKGWLSIEAVRGKRYCTHNTMALINLLIENGDRAEAEMIIDEVASGAKEIEAACCFEVSDAFRDLWLKYIILLEKYGYPVEADRWKEKLISKQEMTDEDIACETSYLKGEYEEALRSSGGDKAVNQMMKYIVEGKLPEEVNPTEVEILMDKAPDSIHCRGYYVGEDMRAERQLTNAEWHKFFADMKTLTGMFEKGLKGETSRSIYPPEYYITDLSYDPEPPIMRGDYVKYFYVHKGKGNWLGLSGEDFTEIEKAVTESSK